MLGKNMYLLSVLTCLFLFQLITVCVKGESISDVDKLLRDKFSPAVYNKEIRGKNDQSETLNVSITFKLQYIRHLDDLKETLQVLGVLFIEWNDERLVWDPEEYNNTRKVFITADKVWRPEIVVSNPSSEVRFIGNDISRQAIEYHHSGVALWTVGDIIDSLCSVDLTAFPWDVQNCTIMFVALTYRQHEVQLVAKEDTMKLIKYDSNGQWKVLSTRTYTSKDQLKSYFVFEVVMKRRSTFFIVNILLPIIILSVLDLFVFIIPVETGERTSFSITVLLSIGVFITLISENLPPNAETMAGICYLLLCVLGQSTFVCLLNIICLKIYFKNENEPVPKCFAIMLKPCNIQKVCSHVNKTVEMKKDPQRNDQNELDQIKCPLYIDDHAIYMSWKDVSKLFDTLFLALMILFLIISYSLFVYHL